MTPQNKKTPKGDEKSEDATMKLQAEFQRFIRRWRDVYPKISIDPANGDPEFINLVTKTSSEINFDTPGLFYPIERRFYRAVRRDGLIEAYRAHLAALKSLPREGDEYHRVDGIGILLGYGARLLERIPETDRRRLMPYNDVHVLLEGHEIKVTFSSMLSHRAAGGRVFYGRRKPTIEFNGETKIVAFSRHAIERICERLNPRYTNYGPAGDIHAFFSTCIYFEPIRLRDGQPAFVLYDMCGNKPYVQYRTYIKGVFGEENLDPSKGSPYYKVGYCPVVFVDGYAKATTFLYPGYTSTPEYGLILSSKLSRSDRDNLIDRATSQDGEEVVLKDNPTTIKWFHENGIPQVVQMKQTVFVDRKQVH